MSGQSSLRPYVHSKWKCPFHGYFHARTAKPVDPARPIHCPECKAELLDQLQGRTSQSIPFVSKPRWPKKTDIQPIASSKAPLRKRGAF